MSEASEVQIVGKTLKCVLCEGTKFHKRSPHWAPAGPSLFDEPSKAYQCANCERLEFFGSPILGAAEHVFFRNPAVLEAPNEADLGGPMCVSCGLALEQGVKQCPACLARQ